LDYSVERSHSAVFCPFYFVPIAAAYFPVEGVIDLTRRCPKSLKNVTVRISEKYFLGK
jgi:hypothetical protein